MNIKHYTLLIFLSFSSVLAFAQNKQLAKQYLMNGELEKAAEIYESVYKNDRSQSVYEGYLDCLIGLNDLKGAEKLVKKQIKTYKQQPTYRVDLGNIYKSLGEDKDKEDAYQDAIDLLESNPGMTNNLAAYFVKANELDWALKTYRKGEDLMPYNNFSLQIAEIYAQKEDTEQYINEFLKLISQNEGYLQSVKNRLRRIISDDPFYEVNTLLRSTLLERIQQTQQEVYIDLLTWLFVQEKNFDQAFIQLRALDKRLDSDQKRLYQLGRIALNNQAYDASVNCYKYIIEVGPKSPFYLDAKISLLRVLQEKIVSTTTYSQDDLITLERTYFETLNEFGGSNQTLLLTRDLAHLQAFYLDKADTAQIMLETALESGVVNDRLKAELKLELADIYLFKGFVWDAILLYGQVEKAFKEDVIGKEAKFRRARVYYFTGDFGFAEGQLDVLKASTTKLIANDAMKLFLLINDNIALDTTTDALAMYARADLAHYRNRPEEALVILDSLMEIHILNGVMDDAIFKKAIVLRDMKRFPESVQVLEELVKNYSFEFYTDDAYFLLGQMYEEQLEDKDKAMDMYKVLLTDYPGSVFTVEARKRFRNLRGDDLKPRP